MKAEEERQRQLKIAPKDFRARMDRNFDAERAKEAESIRRLREDHAHIVAAAVKGEHPALPTPGVDTFDDGMTPDFKYSGGARHKDDPAMMGKKSRTGMGAQVMTTHSHLLSPSKLPAKLPATTPRLLLL